MADGAIGQNGVNAQFHVAELITPELGFVITLLQLMVVLTVSEMHLKLEDATKILVQVKITFTLSLFVRILIIYISFLWNLNKYVLLHS